MTDKLWRFSHNKNYDYAKKEVLKHFVIKDDMNLFCYNDFGICKAGKYYQYFLHDDHYSVEDWRPFETYFDCDTEKYVHGVDELFERVGGEVAK